MRLRLWEEAGSLFHSPLNVGVSDRDFGRGVANLSVKQTVLIITQQLSYYGLCKR